MATDEPKDLMAALKDSLQRAREERERIERVAESSRAAGRAEAIADLRDTDRFVQWAFKARPDTGVISDVCADYLESQTKPAEVRP